MEYPDRLLYKELEVFICSSFCSGYLCLGNSVTNVDWPILDADAVCGTLGRSFIYAGDRLCGFKMCC